MKPDSLLETFHIFPEAILLLSGNRQVVGGNDAFARRFHRATESLRGVDLLDLVADDEETVTRFLRHCARSRDFIPGALRLTRPGDESIACRVEGGVLQPRNEEREHPLLLLRFSPKEAAVGQFVALNHQIQLIQSTHDRLNFVLDATEVGRWLNELPLTTLNWDQRTRDLFFIPPGEEPTIELFYDRLHPDDREPTRIAMERALRDHAVYEIEHRVLHPDTGEVRWLRSKGMAHYDPSGKPVRFDGINYDITRQKKVEEQLRVAAAQLSEANRRKNEFLAMLAHELRNPLAPLRTGLEVIRLSGDDTASIAKTCAMMEQQVKQLVVLIDDLMDLSRITRGRLELNTKPVVLGEVLRIAIEASAVFIEEGRHRLEVSIPDDPIHLEADPHRLAQVFSNLLINAAKYTDPGGEIRLTVQPRVDGRVAISVADNGIGLKDDSVERIFDMFAQVGRATKDGSAGLGIGLTLVKSLTEMHGGSVEVFSAGPAQGSEFTILMPVLSDFREDGDSEGGARPEETPPEPGPRKRVLVVDDNPDSVETLGLLVRMLGHEVRTAQNGKEALSVASEFSPEIVFLDLGMPIMDGYETARELRKGDDGNSLKIIALSGWGSAEDKIRTSEAGFDHHLVKPAAPDTVRALL